MIEIVLIGAGGFALEIEEYILDCVDAGQGLRGPDGRDIDGVRDAAIVGLLDTGEGRYDEFVSRPPRLGEPEGYDPGARFHVIAIGDAAVREKYATMLTARRARFLAVVHPSAKVSRSAEIGEGALIAPFVFVGPRARVGPHVASNVYCSIGHNTIVGAHTVLSPRSALGGFAELGAVSFMGTGAAINPHKRVGSFAKIAAGSVVYADFADGFFLSGNPAKGRQLFAPK